MKLSSLFTLLCLLPFLAAAEINPKNGNFLITYQDMAQQSSGRELNLRRTYNSRSNTYPGWFGWGWNSPYETRLHPLPDGSLLVRESGSGLMHCYDPAEGGKLHDAGLNAVVEAARVRDRLDARQAADLRTALQWDEGRRATLAIELGVAATPPLGAKWLSRVCGSVDRIADGWRRSTCIDGKSVDYFSSAGLLLRREDETGFVALNWSGDKLTEVKDSGGLSLRYEWTPAGQVANVTGSSGAIVRYSYSAGGELLKVEGKPIPGDRMEFSYDNARRLTRIAYTDTTTHLIAYNSDGLTTSHVERTGVKTTLEYGGSDKKYWTRVQQFASNGDRTGERTYDYEVAASPTGQHAIDRLVVRQGDIQITMSRDGTLEYVDEGAKREEAEERKLIAEARRKRQEPFIREFNACVTSATRLETQVEEASRHAREARRGFRAYETSARRLGLEAESSIAAFKNRCERRLFELPLELLKKLCGHPAWQSSWCDSVLSQ